MIGPTLGLGGRAVALAGRRSHEDVVLREEAEICLVQILADVLDAGVVDRVRLNRKLPMVRRPHDLLPSLLGTFGETSPTGEEVHNAQRPRHRPNIPRAAQRLELEWGVQVNDPNWRYVGIPPVAAPGSSGNHNEVWAYDGKVMAFLVLLDSWPGMTEAEIQERTATGDSLWHAMVRDPSTGRFYFVVEKGSLEDSEAFVDRAAALDRAGFIARDVVNARVGRHPAWRTDDLDAYFAWFQAQVPNRVDYVRLLWANDPNGAYDGLLVEPVTEAQETFEEVFDDFVVTNPSMYARLDAAHDRMNELEHVLATNPSAARELARCRSEAAAIRKDLR